MAVEPVVERAGRSARPCTRRRPVQLLLSLRAARPAGAPAGAPRSPPLPETTAPAATGCGMSLTTAATHKLPVTSGCSSGYNTCLATAGSMVQAPQRVQSVSTAMYRQKRLVPAPFCMQPQGYAERLCTAKVPSVTASGRIPLQRQPHRSTPFCTIASPRLLQRRLLALCNIAMHAMPGHMS